MMPGASHPSRRAKKRAPQMTRLFASLSRLRVIADRRARAHQIAGRHKHCRCAQPATSICRCGASLRESNPRCACKPAASCRRRCHAQCAARDAAARPRWASARHRPRRSRGGSQIIASQKRSSSAFDSDSVGSINQSARHRKTHGRGVKTVVDQAFGDIVHRHARSMFLVRADRRCIHAPRALWRRDTAPGNADRERGDIVGVEDRPPVSRA